jgi:hypothetical protein
MTTRKYSIAPVTAVNPEFIKAIFSIIGQFLPVLMQLFLPKSASAIPITESRLRADFLAALEKDFATNPMSPEEFVQVSACIMAFLQMYRDYVTPTPPSV